MISEKELETMRQEIFESVNKDLKVAHIVLADGQYARIIEKIVTSYMEHFILATARKFYENPEEELSFKCGDYFDLVLRNVKSEDGEKFGNLVAEFNTGTRTKMLVKNDEISENYIK